MTDFPGYLDHLSQIADQMSQQVGKMIDHRGIKGNVREHIVKGVLERILPKKFSIETGIAITRTGKRSSQLDLVIYDEIKNCPFYFLGGTFVFPIECVYASVEVKSCLDKEEIKSAAEAIARLRQLKADKRYLFDRLVGQTDGSVKPERTSEPLGLAPRTYIVAFDSKAAKVQTLQNWLFESASETETFFHGVLVLGKRVCKNWFIFQIPHKKPPEFTAMESDGTIHFIKKLLNDVTYYPMYPASMSEYLDLKQPDLEAE